MAYSFRHTNPELGGVIIKEKVKCGKKNCLCAKGREHYHGGYNYLYWKDYKNKGILRKRYIPQNEARSLSSKIKNAKDNDYAEKLNLKQLTELTRQIIKEQGNL